MTNLSRFFTVILSAGAIAAGALALWDSRTIKVQSNDGRYEHRRVDHDGYVRLVRQISGRPCVYGRSWGYDREGIWVDDGCKAEFEVGRRDYRDKDDRWFGDKDTVRIKSQDKRYASKRVDTRGGVRLLRQLSDSPCIYGRSWGFDRDRVWVDRGCEAIFEVGGSYRDDRRWNDDDHGDCPSWLPGRYSGYDNGRQFNLTIDRNGRVALRWMSGGRWSNDEWGTYHNNSIRVGDWAYGVSRERNGIRLQSSSRSRNSIDLRKL